MSYKLNVKCIIGCRNHEIHDQIRCLKQRNVKPLFWPTKMIINTLYEVIAFKTQVTTYIIMILHTLLSHHLWKVCWNCHREKSCLMDPSVVLLCQPVLSNNRIPQYSTAILICLNPLHKTIARETTLDKHPVWLLSPSLLWHCVQSIFLW